MTDESLFSAALVIDDPAERKAYLDRACGSDPALRGRVDELLEANHLRRAQRAFDGRPGKMRAEQGDQRLRS